MGADLASLLPERARGWRPAVTLPPGHVVVAAMPRRPVAEERWASREWPTYAAKPATMYDGLPHPPVCWLTDGPVSAGLWSHLRAEHHRSGLWPLLVFRGAGGFGWYAEDESSLARLDPMALMAGWWASSGVRLTKVDRRVLGTAAWPGPASPGRTRVDPDVLADQIAEERVAREPAGIALVPATRSADAIGLAGWTATDYEPYSPGALSAVLRTWEDRFGARVLGVGSGTLWVSVAAPPTTLDHAARVAVEHFAFCPEVEPPEERSDQPSDFLHYAATIMHRPLWRFWWD
ncbi:DUF4253 domain-containing protein [Asanoa siamensis]|uniref:DUF4253 domain-containing protein n=1 Tax=Asanoa siamensis TaxID=926357 RepID=UPI0019421822|nr:DUF4253 domain-containing protein [Asanoa siamensis]